MRASLCSLAVALTLAVLCTVPAGAQRVTVTVDQRTGRVSVDAYNAPIANVVNTLYARVTGGDVRYVIERGVAGDVTLSVRDVTPESALRQALDRVSAHYEVRNGVTYIAAGRDRGPSQGGDPFGTDSRDIRRDIRLRDATLTEVARELSDRYGADVRAQGSSRTRITASLSNVTLGDALRSLSRGSDGRMRFDFRERGNRIELIPIEGQDIPRDVPAAFRTPIDIRMRDATVLEAAQGLERAGRVTITVDRDVPRDTRVTLSASNEPLWSVVQRMADAARLRVVIAGSRELLLRRALGSDDGELATCRNCGFDGLRRTWRYCPMCGERIPRR